MRQLLLPIILPDSVTPIKGLLSVGKEDGRVVYFHGVQPLFSHAQEDLATFRMITAQWSSQPIRYATASPWSSIAKAVAPACSSA